jgi:hypothetical protein
MPRLSHLTSCTPTKSSLYSANFLDTVFSEPHIGQIPDIASSKSHAHFPLLGSFQGIRPSQKPCVPSIHFVPY